MEIRVFDMQLEPLGIADEIGSLVWTSRYFDFGEFTMVAPVTELNNAILKEGNIIVKHDERNEIKDASGAVWRRGAQITYKHITKDIYGAEQMELKGYMIGSWLRNRCINPKISMDGTNQEIINRMVMQNCGIDADFARRFERFDMISQEDFGGSSVSYANESYINLGDEVKARAQAGKLGYEILVNERTRRYGFYLYKGTDLTSGNNDGNTPCIFSREFENVRSQEYTSSIENRGTYMYVQGAADENGVRPYVEIWDMEERGLNLYEVYCDASDISRQYKVGDVEKTYTDAEYKNMLKSRGEAELATYGDRISFSSEISTSSNLRYGEDFFLGDRVTCRENRWGIQIDARITEISEIYQKGMESIEATFGESMPTLIEKIRKVR